MRTIRLELRDRTSVIHIGSGVLASIGALASKLLSAERFAIITNKKVGRLYGRQVERGLAKRGLDHRTFTVPDAEASKTLEQAQRIYRGLSDNGFDRDSCIIGLGGGSVGDIAGFVAATYLRGIDHIQVPTTLLSQLDSAIGGKTGVNLPQGKNLVGSFHQPVMVLSDLGTLDTLPERDLRSGLAEAVKYGAVADPKLFSFIERGAPRLLRKDKRLLIQLVSRCSAIKVRIVEKDERDRKERLVLNYGHTLGHALEAAAKYQRYRHGEAVAIGMVFASLLSVKMDLQKRSEHDRLCALLSSLGLPVGLDRRTDCPSLLRFMAADKKVTGGKVRIVLPKGIGKVFLSDRVGQRLVLETLEELRR